MERFAVKGIFVDTPTPDTLRVRDGYMLCEDGRCGAFREAAPAGVPVYDHSGQIITPGFVDLHLHAPQYSYCGTAMDLELLDWLQQYTYPEESHYADADYARAGYGYFVRDLTHSATTRACIFGTLHTDATLELMHQLKAAGLSAFVGKLGMDRNSPDFYREPSPSAGLAEPRRWLDTCADEHMLHDGPVRPMITPRFTPSASDEYMKGLGELAAEYKVPAQSHLSENPSECGWVKEFCPWSTCYGDAYDHFGMLGERTVMAHCVYSDDVETELLRRTGTYVAHCPQSNAQLSSGIAPVRRYLDLGMNVGLGTDVAGGANLSMFRCMADAVAVSKLRWRLVDEGLAPLTTQEALWLATAGGGSFFGRVGSLAAGYEFDALVLDDSAIRTPRDLGVWERVERYVYLAEEGGRIARKFVSGREVSLA